MIRKEETPLKSTGLKGGVIQASFCSGEGGVSSDSKGAAREGEGVGIGRSTLDWEEARNLAKIDIRGNRFHLCSMSVSKMKGKVRVAWA